MAQIVTLQEIDNAKIDVFTTIDRAWNNAYGLNNYKNTPAENKAFELAFKNATSALNNFVSRATLAINQGIGSSVVTVDDLNIANELVDKYFYEKQRAFNVYDDGIRWSGQEKYFRATEKIYNHCVNVRSSFEQLALGEGIEGIPATANLVKVNRTPMYFILAAIAAFVVFLIWIKKRK